MIRVVIVEDEMLVRKGLVITTPWKDYGCQVLGEAVNGMEGYELVLKIKPDLVITDVRMPGMSGIEMITKLKDKVDCEYIIISGYSEFEYARSAIQLGVREYLMKPVEDKALEDAIKNAAKLIEEKNKFQSFKNHMEYSGDSKIMLFKEYFSAGNDSKTDNMNKVIACLETNYQQEISLKDIADKINVSESYLSRLFKNESGYTFNDYLTNYRIKQACALLNDPQIKIYEVADLVGYRSQHYFSVIFKRIVGMTPGEFKKKHINIR